MKTVSTLLVTFFFLFTTSLSSAHHSRANFRLDETITFPAVVKRFEFTNPHTHLIVETREQGGEIREWTIELGSIPVMARLNIEADTFQPGDHLEVRGNPDRNPKKSYLLFHTITKDDGFHVAMDDIPAYGRKVRSNPEGKPGSADFSGIWSIVKPMSEILNAQRKTPTDHLTILGQQQLSTYNPEEDPSFGCTPEGLPRRLGSVYPMIIERRNDRLIVRDEISPDYRTIYLTNAAGGEGPPLSRLGYSVGQIEDGELIITTDHFSAEKWGIAPGIDSGEQKTLRERYWLSDNGRQLNVEATVMDPKYLTQPFTMQYHWKYAPAMKISDYRQCDKNSAGKHIQLEPTSK